MCKYGKDTTHIDARIGERFDLELPARATAGFTWVLTQKPETIQLDHEDIRPVGPQLGGRSIQRFEFVATSAGAGKLVMEHKRPWLSAVGEKLEIEVSIVP